MIWPVLFLKSTPNLFSLEPRYSYQFINYISTKQVYTIQHLLLLLMSSLFRLLLLLIFIVSFAQARKALIINQKQNFSIQPLDRLQATLTLDSDIPLGSHLFFIADGATPNPYDTPALIIKRGTSQWQCSQKSRSDLCVLHSHQIKRGDVFDVDLYCYYNCSFSLQAYLSQEYRMDIPDRFTTFFSSKSSVIAIDLVLPSRISFQTLAVVATIKNIEDVKGALEMFANVGPKATLPSRTEYNLSSIQTGNEGRGIFIKATNLTAGDFVKLLVYGPENMSIVIESYTIDYKNTRDIVLHSKYRGFASQSVSQIYVFDASNMAKAQYGSLYIQFIKYSGYPNLLLSGSQSFNLNTTQSFFIGDSMTQHQLTPQIMKAIDFTGVLYIKVQSYLDSSFELYIEDYGVSSGFTILEMGYTQSDTVNTGQVVNYMIFHSQVTEKNATPAAKHFSLKIESILGTIDFGIRRCVTYETNSSLACFIGQVLGYNSSLKIWNDIKISTLSENYYDFELDVAQCHKSQTESYDLYSCAIQIIVFVNNDSIFPKVNYSIAYIQRSETVQLMEGVASLGSVLPNEFQYFKLSLSSTQNVKQIRFYLTILSGDALMYASTLSKRAEADEFPLADDQVIIFDEDIKQNYYLSVYGFEHSTYTITPQIVLKQGSSSIIQLRPGVIQSHTIGQTGSSNPIKYRIKLPQSQNFIIYLDTLEGNLFYKLTPSSPDMLDQNKVSWQFYDSRVLITPSNYTFSETNEFILSVYNLQNTETTFTITYTLQNMCTKFAISKPRNLALMSNFSECVYYEIKKLEDLDIYLNTPTSGLLNKKITASYSLGMVKNQIQNRYFRITANQFRDKCPNLVESSSSKKKPCRLEIRVSTTQVDEFLTLVVQHASDQMYLFDGLTQTVRANLSKQLSKHFYFYPNTNSSVSIVVDSNDYIQLKLEATIVSQKDYFLNDSSKLYPSYYSVHLRENALVAHTTEAGITGLIILSESLKSFNTTGCVILMSLYADSQQIETEFRITVEQETAEMTVGETRIGYVEAGQVQKYQIYGSDESIRVDLAGIARDCAFLQVYERDALRKLNDEIPESQTSKGHVLLPKIQAKDVYYVLQVTGRMSACAYQISCNRLGDTVFEARRNRTYNLLLSENEAAYLLYQHKSNQSIKIVAEEDYGTFKIQALPLGNRTHISSVKDITDPYVFQSSNENLVIQKTHKNYCTGCYYMIRVSASEELRVDVIVQEVNASVSIKSGLVVRDHLEPNDYEEYIFHAISEFKIRLEVLYGEAEITVSKIKVPFVHGKFKDSIEMQVPHHIPKSRQQVDYFDRHSQYVIKINSSTIATGYTLYIYESQQSMKIKRGVPVELQLKKDQPKCVQFFTRETDDPLFLYVQAYQGGTVNLAFDISCLNQDASLCRDHDSIIVKKEISDFNIYAQFRESPKSYQICFNSSVKQQISVLVASQNYKHLVANSEFITAIGTEPTYFELFAPEKGSIMVEGFECRGQMTISGADDLNDLMAGKQGLVFQHAKTFGHYVAKTAVTSGMYFIGLQSRDKTADGLAGLRYSFYKRDEFPYENFKVSDESIRYEVTEERVTVSVNRVRQIVPVYKVSNHYCKLYLDKDADLIKEGSQCTTQSIFHKVLGFGANFSSVPDTISFNLKRSEFDELFGNQKSVYAAVMCAVEVLNQTMAGNDEFTFFYGPAQISSKINELRIDGGANNIQQAIKWIVLPIFCGLLIVGLSLWYCIRKLLYLPDTELVEEDPAQDKSCSAQTIVNTVPSITDTNKQMMV